MPRVRGIAQSVCVAMTLALVVTGRTASADSDVGPVERTDRGEQAEQVDVQVRYTVRDNDSGLADLQIALRDQLSGQPIEYARRRLAAWIQRPMPTLAEAELRCSDKVRLLATPGPGRRAIVDLNNFRLLAVNEDRTLTFINPFLRVNNAKLEGILTVPGDVKAVLHRPRFHQIWLALPGEDTVLVIDTDTKRIEQTHRFETGSQPVALAEAGGAVWVAQRGRDAWLRFRDAGAPPEHIVAPRVAAFASVPGLPAPIGFGDNGIVRLDGNRAVRDAPGETVVGVAWSGLARRLLLSTANNGLLWLNLEDGGLSQRLAIPATRAMATFDAGRFLLAAGDDALRVIDIATARVTQTHPLQFEVSGIGVTDGFAYLHGAASAQATLLSLADLRHARLRPIEVAVGGDAGAVFRAATTGVGPVASASLMTPIPDGSGMYFANPLDGQIYQYAEGMMAPAGSFSNYRRSPLALLLLDGGMQAVGKGLYEAVVPAPAAGRYELVLSGVEPRFAACETITIEGPAPQPGITTIPRLQARLVGIERDPSNGSLLISAAVSKPDERTADLRIDLTLLAFDRYTGWQRRIAMLANDDGVYQIRIQPPAGARLDLRVGSRAGDLPFHAGGLGSWRAAAVAEQQP